MKAKELQKLVIKNYLKPTLKRFGYLTSGQTWWKSKGDFFIVINMQSSQWNDQSNVHFCFNIGIALTQNLKDAAKKKANYFDLAVQLREKNYLPVERNTGGHRDSNWYMLKDETSLDNFIAEMKIDFERHILPKLEKLETLEDCLQFYQSFPFWGQSLQHQIESLSSR